MIATKASELVTDANQIDQAKEEANQFLAQTNQYLASDQVQAAIAKMEAYNAARTIRDFIISRALPTIVPLLSSSYFQPQQITPRR